MFEFALAVLFLIITPGPGVLSTAGVGSGFGYRAGLAYVGGLFVGNALVSGLVISGVAAVVLAVPGLRGVLVFASTAYLLYLALKIALATAMWASPCGGSVGRSSWLLCGTRKKKRS